MLGLLPRASLGASPSLAVETDGYMFAGHLVAPNTYDGASVFILQTFHNLTNDDTYQWNGLTGPKLELRTGPTGFQSPAKIFASCTAGSLSESPSSSVSAACTLSHRDTRPSACCSGATYRADSLRWLSRWC